MTVADLIACTLRGAGARALFGVPGGGGNLDLIDAAGRAGLPFVLTSTETAGAIAALAQAEITGQPGACLTTLGPGAASVVNGVACAYLDRAPLVVFTDSHASRGGAFEHQRIDHAALMAPVTKSSETLRAEDALQVMRRAVLLAADGRPGPVHIDCPGDVAAASTAMHGAVLVGSVRHAVLPEAYERLDLLLRSARKPLLLVGLGARRAEDAAAIRALCDGRGVPAMVTYKAKGVVPDDHAWFAGVFTNAAIEQDAIDESDLLIGLGLDPVELIPRPWKHRQPVVCVGRWRVEDGHVPFALQIVSSVSAGAETIENTLRPSEWDPARVQALAGAQRRRVDLPDGTAGAARSGREGLTAQQVVSLAEARLSSAAGRVTVDAGAHMFAATTLWPVRDPNGMLISNGLSTMGFALPAAVGAATIDRDRPVVALTGDGGLLMCAGELATAVRERLRIVTIVFNDASLSLIEIKQQARGLPASGVALGAIHWRRLAESVGMAAWTAEDEPSLDRAIDGALAQGGPALIEAKVDRSNYGATLRAIRG
jgi:acetolactate synthase-1/2/3 large subunit